MDITSVLLLTLIFLVILIPVFYLRRGRASGVQKTSVQLDSESIRGVAVSLARGQKAEEGADHSSLAVLNRAAGEIRRAQKALSAVPEEEDLVPAGRWILDNIFMLEQEIFRVQNMLKTGPASLPIIKTQGIPRVCWISDNLLSYTNGRLDSETLAMYLNEYQKKMPLMLKELWILPAFLRLSVLKRVAEVAAACTETHAQWDSAEAFAEYIASAAGDETAWELRSRRNPWMRKDGMGGAFLERLSMRLMEQGESSALPLKWLDRMLSERGFILEDQVASSHHRQGAEKLLIGNCMDSLRYLDALNWLELFRQVSVVERTLLEDPAGVYRRMDEQSRGMYRRRIERLAERWHVSELHLTRLAVQCARERADSAYDKEKHIGYYIAGEGRNYLAQQVKGKKFVLTGGRKLALYAGTIWALSALLAAGLTCLFAGGWPGRAVLFLAAVISFSKIGVYVVDEVVKHSVRSEVIPAIDLKDGIPDEGRTLIIIPALLTSLDRVNELAAQLETLYLRHGGGNLHYCLLADLKDEKQPDEERDAAMLRHGAEAIGGLNGKYGDGTFTFLARKRQYNASEGVFMGAERKRGAIMALNRLLLTGSVEEFTDLEQRPEGLEGIRFVLTLDADTELPHDAAVRLIGMMLHPMNRPEVVDGAVRKGYAILQPRVELAADVPRQSEFSAIYTGRCGLDHYSGAVADAYQDLFGEGIFTGKGIYDLHAFMEVLDGTLPENRVLSHDLLEGSYARAGFVSDVAVVDGFPSSAYSYFVRLNRWLRGDWQIMGWLGRRAPGGRPNPINRLSKYKISDNLRRALAAPAELAVLLLFAYAGALWVGLLAVLLIELFPAAFALYGALTGGKQGSLRLSLRAARADLLRPLLNMLFLPFEAWISLDAAARSLWRLTITKKHLLKWTTAADAERGRPDSPNGYWRYMIASPVLATVIAVVCIVCAPGTAGKVWGLVALAWVAAPQVAWSISRATPQMRERLDEHGLKLVRLIARRTWHYFERFVTTEEHFLAPDNFQEYPFKGVASRTSPTNIGLSLLANASAMDMGYILPAQFLERCTATIESVNRLQKWQGHLYNWYDTRTTEPLHPLYVSTVDSGNLMAYLLLTAEAVRGAARGPLLPVQAARGLADTIGVLCEKKPDAVLTEIATSLEQMAEHNRMRDIVQLADKAAEAAEKLGGKWAALVTEAADDLVEESEPLLAVLELLPDENRVMLEGDWDAYASPACWEERGKAAEAVRAALAAGPNRKLEELFEQIGERFAERAAHAAELAAALDKCALDMNLMALYDKSRDLFTIGSNVEQGKASNSFYDLLASEARLTSLLGIAWGKIPARHWKKLGRALTLAGGGMPLLSWGGTMFEYLMPALTLKHPPCTLLGETVRSVIRAQIDYAADKGVPWGVSESGYHEFDLNLNYQYRSFGVPDTGMRSGLARDMVIAPYATLMALPFLPAESLTNIERLASMGMMGEYGMYEAMDFTPERRLEKDRYKIVKSYMVHHQGMALAAMVNLLHDDIMVRRLHSLPEIRSVELLMEERAPDHGAVLEQHDTAEAAMRGRKPREVRMVRTLRGTEGLWPPEVQLLSNGSYTVHIAASGAGQSRWEGMAVNRWRDDAVSQAHGIFFYIRDPGADRAWSAAMQPMGSRADDYEVHMEPHMVSFRRRDGDVGTCMDITVAADSPAEVRRLTFTNQSELEKRLEVTVYFEAILNAHQADEAHPAFQNLFVQTEYLPESGVVLVRRRPRDSKQGVPHMACRFAGDNGPIAPAQYDTSREACLGRGRTAANPVHMEGARSLGSSEGNVLDPAVCMRVSVMVPARGTASVSFLVTCAWDRQKALALSDALAAPGAVERAFEMAWTQEQANMRYLGVKPNQLRLYSTMSAYVLYNLPAVAARLAALESVPGGQSALWELGVSGDNPIIVLKVSDLEHLEAVRHLLLAHAWWRFKGMGVDLVLLNEYGNDYRRPLHEKLHDAVITSHERDFLNRRNGVFMVTVNQASPEAIRTLLAAARCVLQAGQPLTAQLRPLAAQAALAGGDRKTPDRWEEAPLQEEETIFGNGTGGFTESGAEYVIELDRGVNTPMPWCNVLTNGSMGMVTTEAGAGYTWMANSRENKLTPWLNDPVSGGSGEGLYVRDRETGDFWSPSPGPARGAGTYRVRHGQGWTAYEYGGYGLLQENAVFLPFGSDVRVQIFKIFNPGPRVRDLDVTWYCDLVLGTSRETTAPFLTVRRDAQSGALWAENGYRSEFRGQKVFLAAPGRDVTYTANRCEFVGILGSVENPAGMYRDTLSGSLGVGLGGCCALRFQLRVPPGMSRQAVLLLGVADDFERMRQTVKAFSTVEQAREAFKATCRQWNRDLSVIAVKTPDSAMDIMVNRWLLYQAKASRVMGRAGFYQAGGAIGFRDQLQDMLALVWTAPDDVRAHILECAGHQFEAGDVQHWWHPPLRGVRTRMSDDLVFLAFLTADYIEHTGNVSILNETALYLKDVPIPEGQEDWYGVAERSDLAEPLYLHCLRALRLAAKTGEHGLPLMGTGDWNDAMSSVGDEGRGESVWLGMFLSHVLRRFAGVLRLIELYEDADELERTAEALAGALEEHGWDGAWYRRAFFDDGTPLGSAINDECRIDCISQAWAAISGFGDKARVESAMQAVEKHLVSWEDGILRLLWPPFVNTAMEPGYIKGYLAGVRENGGQYTHGALWAVWAYAEMGLGDMAWRLLYMLNPVQHSSSPMGKDRYKVEPYVVAADIYSMPPLTGRGGWTWYTGSAAWMYRITVEYLLGLRLRGDKLLIEPCIPAIWREYNMEYRYGRTRYIIHVENARGVCRGVRQVILDGHALPDKAVKLSFDGEIHYVHVLMGE